MGCNGMASRDGATKASDPRAQRFPPSFLATDCVSGQRVAGGVRRDSAGGIGRAEESFPIHAGEAGAGDAQGLGSCVQRLGERNGVLLLCGDVALRQTIGR
jgi:hypothetical protein